MDETVVLAGGGGPILRKDSSGEVALQVGAVDVLRFAHAIDAVEYFRECLEMARALAEPRQYRW